MSIQYILCASVTVGMKPNMVEAHRERIYLLSNVISCFNYEQSGQKLDI